MLRTKILSHPARRASTLAVVAAVLVSSTLAASTASAQEAQFITVILTELRFNPTTITLTMGQPVQLNVQNQGKAQHNLSSDLPVSKVKYLKADNDPSELRAYEANNVLDTDANGGSTSVVIFTPTQTGTFQFSSGAGDDEKNGMVGTFIVVGPGGQAAVAPAASAPTVAPVPSTNPNVAGDGQSLSTQSAATQAMFNSVWGDRAAQEWVQEHNASLSR